MSNEIKFRALDGVKFIYRGLHDRNWYTEDKGGKLVKPTHPSDKNMFIMQFTGLKDKNGIDIYEGDFDQYGDVVRWCDVRNGWAMSSYDFPTKEHIFCHCYNCDGNFELSEITKEIEIKGNIHEIKQTK